jgi:transposase
MTGGRLVPTQLALKFDDVPVTCPTQERYHSIAPCLAGIATPAERAASLNIGYSTITRWLREFRENGMRGLFPATEFPLEPYTPERVIVTLLYFKCCVPKAGDRELARVVTDATGHQLHNETVKALLHRYFFWQYPEFQKRIQYPVSTDPQLRRLEMVKLQKEGWSEKSVASLLHCTPKTVNKWLRRYKQEQSSHSQSGPQQWLMDRSHAPTPPAAKGLFRSDSRGAHATKEIWLCRLVPHQGLSGTGLRHLPRPYYDQEDHGA